eukprot:UN08669
MNCGEELDEKYINTIAPKAVSMWKQSLFKFKLKKCADFKFCPNIDCNQGFSIYELCAETNISCPQCKTKFCRLCNSRNHEGDCIDFMKKIHYERWDR